MSARGQDPTSVPLALPRGKQDNDLGCREEEPSGVERKGLEGVVVSAARSELYRDHIFLWTVRRAGR